MHDALYYTKLEKNRVQCNLCPTECIINNDSHGICNSRINKHGILKAATYMQAAAIAVDPIEKKPLYHFHPASQILSLGQHGCNLSCKFCQNHNLSQHYAQEDEISVEHIINFMKAKNSIGIAYTYSEPLIWFESIMNIGPKVRDEAYKNVMVTNGFINPEPLNDLLEFMDAFNVDIKSIDDSFYRKLCGAKLEPVLKTCEAVKKTAHLEITNLIITDQNDTDEDIDKLARYIRTNLGKDTPLHLSRYFPNYKFTAPATKTETIYRAREIASQYLDYVYTGNIIDPEGSKTKCPKCSEILITRNSYNTTILNSLVNRNKKTSCNNCGSEIPIFLE